MTSQTTNFPPLAAPPCSTFVRMFKPQFAALVESGEKCQTVRPTPKRMPKKGDRISLRAWTGKPYRSKQRILRESVVGKVATIRMNYAVVDGMTWWEVQIDGQHIDSLEVTKFAQADGFADFTEMAEWFIAQHGLPFEGIVIYWSNKS
jgi:hypothetical protein